MTRSTKAALVLLAAGAVCCGVAVGMGAAWSGNGNSVLFGRQEQTADKQLVCDGVSELVLDIDTAEVIVTAGDSWSLTAGESTSWDVSGGTLTIEQDSETRWWWGRSIAAVELTMPADAVSSIEVTVDAGSVTMRGITAAQSLWCEVDAGEIVMRDMTAGQLDADCDVGQIEFSGVVYGPVTLSCDVGSIEAELQAGSTVGYVDGAADLGSIEVNVNGESVVAPAGMKATVTTALPSAAGDDLLTIDCDVGSIVVNLLTQADAADAA